MNASTSIQRGYLGKAEAAFYLGISARTLDSARSRGVLPFYRFGRRRVLFKRDDLDAWLAGMRVCISPDDRGTTGTVTP